MTRLTKTAIAKLLADAKPAVYWDDELGGFGFRIYPSGEAAYVVDYRLRGSRAKRRIVLGKVAELTPQMARERAKEVKAAARTGVDLDQETRAGVKRREDEERRKAVAMTVGTAVAAYLEMFELTVSRRSGRQPAASSVRAETLWLTRLSAMDGPKPLEELTADDVRVVLEATPQASRRNVFGALSRLMQWARRQGVMGVSPLERIDPPARPASRDRTPSPGEVVIILKAADDLMGDGRWRQVQRDAIWLLALTAQRRAEVANMAWEDVDLVAGEWRQPGEKNKTGKPHVVPLGRQALDILKRAHAAAALRQGQEPTGRVLRGVMHGGSMNKNFGNLNEVLRRLTGVNFRLHDFRRSAVSAMAERGVDFADADALLNHAASASRTGMIAVYQHSERKAAKRRAMQLWEDALFEGQSAGNVVRLRAC